jgi:hypothetical protein
VSRNRDDLVAVRQGGDPCAHLAQLVEVTAAAQVACVYEDIAIGDVEVTVKQVRVGDGDDPHAMSVCRRRQEARFDRS